MGAGAVVVREGAILLVRSTYGWSAGHWLIPNGSQRPGETLADCALRELREEAGLEGTAGAPVALRTLAGPLGADTFVALRVHTAPGVPRPDRAEVDAAGFFTLDEMAHTGGVAGDGVGGGSGGGGSGSGSGPVVPLHRLIAAHILGGRSGPPVQDLPARDRDGNAARATLYLF